MCYLNKTAKPEDLPPVPTKFPGGELFKISWNASQSVPVFSWNDGPYSAFLLGHCLQYLYRQFVDMDGLRELSDEYNDSPTGELYVAAVQFEGACIIDGLRMLESSNFFTDSLNHAVNCQTYIESVQNYYAGGPDNG